jgi:hypothetical protein
LAGVVLPSATPLTRHRIGDALGVRAGSAPGGSIHEFNTPASNTEDTDTFMVVFGANVNFLKDGTYINLMDASLIKAWVDQGIKDQGATKMNYISAQVPTYTR